MKEEIKTALKAKISVLWIPTTEELRTERRIIEVASSFGTIRDENGEEIDGNYQVNFWSVTKGMQNMGGSVIDDNPDPVSALQKAANIEGGRIITIFRDFGAYLNDPRYQRALRDAIREAGILPRSQAKSIIIIDKEKPSVKIPGIRIVESEMPKRADLEKILSSIIPTLPDGVENPVNGKIEEIISAGIGLSVDQFSDAVSRSVVSERKIDPKIVSAEKKAIISEDGTFEWITDDITFSDLGGYDEIQPWAKLRSKAFSKAAREYGLPIPKGILLVGVPGCGKSLIAKIFKTAWGMPLLRLDIGALFSKYVGDSEASVRRIWKILRAVSPCILWIDEIDKGFSEGSGESDGGTSKRVFGTFLTEMQENKDPVFIIATANDVSALRPELLRAGRFDERFFLDLPNREERIQISKVMSRRYAKAEKVDVSAIASASEGFSGAEIEAGFKAALFRAFDDGIRLVKTEDVLVELKEIVPIAKTMKEKIDALRKWAEGKARFASKKSDSKTAQVRAVEL